MVRKSYRLLETVSTVEGTIYKGDIVHFQNEEDNGDWRVKDTMGKIWYIKPQQLTDNPVILSKEKENE
tara:strand:- start:815 stop:1018 length:204 start_codon:yes stop_codon:yes gene_type:complete